MYCAFGFGEYNIIQIISLQAILYATVSGIPLPGAVGVSEGGFLAIFRHIYSENMVNSAMLLSRGINFYLFVIISSIVAMIGTIREKKQELEIQNIEIENIE